jgi:hypothetical protein
MTPEKRLWERLRDGWGLQIKQAGGRIERVENAVGAGMPDVNGCLSGVEFWIELKVAPKWGVRRPTFRAHRGLEPAQINWLLSEYRAGGKSFVLAQIDKEVFLVPGELAQTFNDFLADDFILWGVDMKGVCPFGVDMKGSFPIY